MQRELIDQIYNAAIDDAVREYKHGIGSINSLKRRSYDIVDGVFHEIKEAKSVENQD